MDHAETLRLLWHMRDLHVRGRRRALVDRNLDAFRQNQSDVDMVDRAIYDETQLQREWVDAETARIGRPPSDEGPSPASAPASSALP